MSNILIEANNVTKIYDPDILLKRGKNFYALDNVSFVLEEGDFTCIMGPSGSGKSTLLNCLSTLDTITSGHILLNGTDMTTLNKNQLCQFRYETLGFVFQNHNLIPYLTIFDNIAAPVVLGKQDPKIIREKIYNLAKDLEIENILDKFPAECSGGEGQRVAIARALINDPKIIFCDEPTGNLDSKNSHKVLSILSHLNRNGVSILLVTHDPMIASYAKNMIYLYDGGIKSIIHKNDASQIDFFKKINEITTQDSLLHEFASADQIISASSQSESTVENLNMQDQNKEFVAKQTVYMMIDSQPYDEQLYKHNVPFLIKGTHVSYRNKRNDDVSFDLKDIKEVHLELKSQFANLGLFSQYMFYPLVDFICNEGTYHFLSRNKDDFIQIINYLHSLDIPIQDPRHIEEAYHQYPKELERCKFFQRTHKDLTNFH
ncbi:MAG: ABC transporter ATP-binding protein [Coprobacillus sp.]